MKNFKSPYLLIVLSIASLLASPARAQYPSSDTLVKVIWLTPAPIIGDYGENHITFKDPNGLPNHVEITQVEGPLFGIGMDRPDRDSVRDDIFKIGATVKGEYLLRAAYKREPSNSSQDSGVEYIRVHVIERPDVPIKFNDVDCLQALTVPVSDLFSGRTGEVNFFRTESVIYSTWDMQLDPSRQGEFWRAPNGRRIVEMAKSAGEGNVLNIMLDDGSIYRSIGTPRSGFAWPVEVSRVTTQTLSEQWTELRGDDLYVLSTNALYVTRDFGKSWQTDTAGLNGAFAIALDLDSSQNVYLATSSGLLRQGPKQTSWTPVSSLSLKYVSRLFIDRRDRIFAAGLFDVCFSTDRGSTWTKNSAGLAGAAVGNFGDDAYGKIYMTTAGAPNKVLRSTGGTGAWQEIAQSVGMQSADSTAVVFHYVAGDSVLLLTTLFGLYTSTDQGTTWSEMPFATREANLYGLVRDRAGSFIVSTNRGLYQGAMTDSIWTKRYPATGFRNGAPIWRDDGGVVYTQGPTRIVNYNTVQPLTYRSVDNGLTWSVDTLGMSAIPIQGSFYVDARGVQHCVTQIYGAAIDIFSKAPGAAWQKDESGFVGRPTDFPQALGADRNGNIYLSIANGANDTAWVWKRGGSGWSLDTVGLNRKVLYSFVGGRNADVYAVGTDRKIYRNANGTWQSIASPTSLSGSVGTGVISIDSSGAIFAAFVSGPTGANLSGVFFTTDNGVHWTKAGVEGLAVSGLVSYGDTTYALTGLGIFAVTRAPAASVHATTPVFDAMEVSVYPNPSSGELKLGYTLADRSTIAIEVYSMLGEKLRALQSGTEAQGTYQKQFDLHSLKSGTYLLSITKNGIRTVKSFQLLK